MKRITDSEKEFMESLRYRLFSFFNGAPRQAVRINIPSKSEFKLDCYTLLPYNPFANLILNFPDYWIQTDTENLINIRTKRNSKSDCFLNSVYNTIKRINGPIDLNVDLKFIDIIPKIATLNGWKIRPLEEDLLRDYPIVVDGKVEYTMDLQNKQLKIMDPKYTDPFYNKFTNFAVRNCQDKFLSLTR
jgi:hypothetical protein